MTKILFALALIPAFAQAECDRASGTPGFEGVSYFKSVAKNDAMDQCGYYQNQTDSIGECTHQGCEYSALGGGYYCRVLIILCSDSSFK